MTCVQKAPHPPGPPLKAAVRSRPEPAPIAEPYVGRDEVNGVPSQPRKDLSPPPHWRLEAVAATERPRSLTVAEDGTRAVFIQDRDTSDVWLLDLTEPRPLPQRLTTGREPVPYWEDVEPRLSPGGSQVAYAAADHVWLVAAAGGPPRRLLEASNPVWVDDATLIVSIERGDMTRLGVVSIADPWPRPLAATAAATSGRRPCRPTAQRSPTCSPRAPTSTAPRSAWPRWRAAPSMP